MPPSNGNTEKALRPWTIMLMALAANFQDAGTDDIPAYVFKMHACVLQFSSIMSMIQKRKRARIYWVGRATGRMCEARTPRDWDAYLQEAHMTDNRFRRMFRIRLILRHWLRNSTITGWLKRLRGDMAVSSAAPRRYAPRFNLH